jgi:hypothetical protein
VVPVSWFQYLDIIRQARVEREYWASNPPLACPLCGQPLIPGPQSAEVTLFCPVEGWAYPRDWVRPEIL